MGFNSNFSDPKVIDKFRQNNLRGLMGPDNFFSDKIQLRKPRYYAARLAAGHNLSQCCYFRSVCFAEVYFQTCENGNEHRNHCWNERGVSARLQSGAGEITRAKHTRQPKSTAQFQDDEDYSLHQSFAVHAHSGSVRTVDTRGKYLASGGADDRIFIYDMKTRQEIQMLNSHNGIVNHLQFTPDATHLFSAASDGTFSATRTGSWMSEGFWKSPHNGKSVNHLSIHPSGKLALTLGSDLTLKTWNLVKGRQTFTTNLKSKSKLGSAIDFVEFSTDGQNFLLSGAKAVEIWSIERAMITREIECDSKPSSVCWLDAENLLIGLANGKLMWCNLEKDESLTFEMYDSRVKALQYRNGFLASASSDGDVTVWSVDISENDITELCAANIGCRPICLTIINLADFSDEYVLKLEKEEEEETTSEVPKSEQKVNGNRQVGKVVVIEEGDDDEGEKEKPKTNENLASKSPKKGKRKSLSKSEPKTPTKKPKSASANRSANSSGFVEEDI